MIRPYTVIIILLRTVIIYNRKQMWPSPYGAAFYPVLTLRHSLWKQIQLHEALAKNVDFIEDIVNKWEKGTILYHT